MSTTTVGDLLDRAEILARSLRVTDAQISTTQWCSFDATAYRLLHELVGPERVGAREQILSHAGVSRILNSYPSPLAAPNPQTTYNAKQAANHLGVSSSTVIADIRESRLPATFDGRRYSIKATTFPPPRTFSPPTPPAPTPWTSSPARWASWPTWSSPNAPEPRPPQDSTHCATTHRSPPSWPGSSP